MGTAAEPWRMYAEERADIHDFLASLSPGQWDAASLCATWTGHGGTDRRYPGLRSRS
jgi:hypothetical protein